MTEVEALNRKVQEAKDRTEAVLKARYGANRTLNFLPVNDRRRLSNLFIWAERYSLSLESILEILLSHYDQYIRGKKRRRNPALPVSAKTLMGRHSEEVIRLKLNEDYPNEENVTLYKQVEQQRQVNQRFELEHLSTETKLLEECASVEDYIKSYDQKMQQIYSQMSSVRSYLRRNTRPYRNNPWR